LSAFRSYFQETVEKTIGPDPVFTAERFISERIARIRISLSVTL